MIKVPRIVSVILVTALFLTISQFALAAGQQEGGTPEAPAATAAQEEGGTPEAPAPKKESFLKQIEETAPAKWIREDPSIFAWAGILLLHTFGMGLVVGINAGIDLRILGLAREIPLAPLAKFFPVLWVGFFLNAVTGVLLLYADISTKLPNPDFWVKIAFISLAVGTLLRIRKSVFSDPLIDSKPLPASAKLLAFMSLIFWIGAVTAGRLLAYVGSSPSF